MDLSQADKHLIKRSYAQLQKNGSNVAECFYKNLFDMAPLIKPLFKGEQSLLTIHFNELISSAVNKVDQFEALENELIALGKRHKTYQAKEQHFAIVKSALLLSIEYELKSQCTEEVLLAWSKYIDQICNIMINALHQAEE